MSRKVVTISNRQRLDVQVSDPQGANRLLIYTGTAVLDGRFAIDNRLISDDVAIILGGHTIADPNIGDNFAGRPFSPINAVASVALAAVVDLGDSDNVGWAVDEATIEEVFVDQTTKFLKIHTRIAFQGEAAALLRLSYHANVLAVAAQEDLKLRSFTLIPERINAHMPNGGMGVSQGTVTIDRPAPDGGVVIKLTAKSQVPNLVSFPPNIAIGAGESSANFDATVTRDDFGIEDVLIMASYGPDAMAAKLTVVA